FRHFASEQPASSKQTSESFSLTGIPGSYQRRDGWAIRRAAPTFVRMMRPKLIGALLLCACVRNPATGKLQLDLVSRDQEVQMGQQAKQETEQTIGVYKENDGLTRLVADVGKQVSAVSNEPQDPFSYEIA